MSRKDKISKEIKETKAAKNIIETKEEESFVDFNPLDALPDMIDKDYSFFLMFGKPDNPIPGPPSNNYDAEINTRELGLGL